MAIAFFWLLFAIAVGVWASNKGRSGVGWFLLSLIISPLLGTIFCAVSKDLSRQATNDAAPTSDTHVRCSACAEYVLPEATRCKHCGATLTAQPNYASDRARQRDDLETQTWRTYFAVLLGIGLLLWAASSVFA